MPTRALRGVLVAALAGQAAEAIEAPPCATYGAGYNDPFRNEVPNGGLLATSLDCQRVCQKTVFCERFTFYNNSGGCWLQGNNWTEVVSPYIISGPVLCPGEVRPGEIGPFGPLDEEAQEVWASVLSGNVSMNHNMAAGSTTINTGLTDAELAGKVVVVHDVTGARVACAPLLAVEGKLVAKAFTPYPGYAGPLKVTGSVDFNTPEVKTDQAITYALGGSDPKCSTHDASEGIANSCGIHIHEGEVCTDAGGHLYNHTTDTTDPWQAVVYTTLEAYPSKELATLGNPTAVAEQVVNGKNFIYTWTDHDPPVNITVLKQLGGELEVTDVTGLPEPEIKARESLDESTGGGFPWWGWLLIVLGIILLAGVIYALCFGGKSKKPKPDFKSKKSKVSTRDVENGGAEKTPLITESAAGQGASGPPVASTEYAVPGAQMNMSLGPSQIQSPLAAAGQPVIASVATPVVMAPASPVQYVSAGVPQYVSGGQSVVYQSQPAVMSGAQPMVMSGAQPMVMSGAQPMVMSGAQPMVMSGAQAAMDANALFDQLDTDGDGKLSPQELARMSGRM